MAGVGHDSNDEIEFLALLLDAAKVASPLIDVGWIEAWAEGLVTAEDVRAAAEDLEA